MKVLAVQINIGEYQFNHAISVTIESSWSELSDTCIIELPSLGRFTGNGGEWEEVDIKAGLPVEVRLGYGQKQLEFQGYVQSYDWRIPYVVKCEGESYQLKRQKPITKSWKSISMSALLEEVLQGFDYEINSSIPEVNLSPFTIKSKTPAEVLQVLANDYVFAAYFRGTKLFIGLPYTEPNLPRIFYALNGKRGNIVSDSGLSYRTKDQLRIKIKAISLLKNNTKIEVEAGDADGELRTIVKRGIASETELKKIAEQEVSLWKYDGYDGSLEAYGDPYISHSYSVEVEDNIFPNRKGVYLVDAVTTVFGVVGFRRNVQIGPRL